MKKRDKVIKKLERIFAIYQNRLQSNGMSVLIENEDRSFVWSKSCGDLEGDRPFFTASVTKLFATTVLLKLIDEGKLSFDDKIIEYLPKEYTENLHTYKGVDYTKQLTVKHLMTQTSGLPDYFTESNSGAYVGKELVKHDQLLTLDEIVERTKKMEAKFVPGSKKRAYYSDANWDIFLPIIEKLTGMSVKDCYEKYIIGPLNLQHTYLFTEGMEFNVPGIWIEDGIYKVPLLALAWPLSGSLISNNQDMVVFLKAFWSGQLFSMDRMKEVNTYYYTQFFPIEYGLGNMRFRSPGMPSLYGHTGASGVVCYYSPKYHVYISACINELEEVKVTRMLAKYSFTFRHIGKKKKI